MTWRCENEGCFWAFKLDVRDFGHLDVTQRALAGALSSRVKKATSHVIAVGTLPMMVCSKYLLAGLHGCEGAAISVSALGSFRSAVARAVSSQKLPVTNTNTHALLSLLMALGVRI